MGQRTGVYLCTVRVCRIIRDASDAACLSAASGNFSSSRDEEAGGGVRWKSSVPAHVAKRCYRRKTEVGNRRKRKREVKGWGGKRDAIWPSNGSTCCQIFTRKPTRMARISLGMTECANRRPVQAGKDAAADAGATDAAVAAMPCCSIH